MLHDRKFTEKFTGSQGRQYDLIRVFAALEHFHASRNHNEERGSHAALDHNSLAGLVVLYASGLRHPFDVVCAQILEERCLFEQFCFVHFCLVHCAASADGCQNSAYRGFCQRLGGGTITVGCGTGLREENDETTDILIGEGDDWPEDYSDGFDAPMKVISEILLDSEAWDLPISWPEVLSRLEGAGKLLDCLESIDSSVSAYKPFDAVEGCSVDHESWGGDSPGRSGCWISVFVRPEKHEQARETVLKLSDALRSYWIASGKAAAAEQCWRDYKAKKGNR